MVNMRIKKQPWRVLLFCVFAMISCSEYLPEQGGDIVNVQESFTAVESVVFELNGTRYTAGAANGNNDTVILQEEGLRTFKIVGYKPEDAYPAPSVGRINFYQDIYAFNYFKDSIIILGGEYAKPVNHSLNFTDGNFGQLHGTSLAKTDTIKFYNKVNRAYDSSVIEFDGIMQELLWESLGKLRRYRIELIVVQQGEEIYREHPFTLPFYERTNKVEIIGIPHKSSQYIELSPGDSLQLEFNLRAPEEFATYEWAKGAANNRFDTLNGDNIELSYMSDLRNTLLTEDGKRYTDSMVTLSRDGMLSIDKNWEANKAASNSGHIYNEVPICVIMMPHKKSGYNTAANKPTPFFCNGVVKVIAGK